MTKAKKLTSNERAMLEPLPVPKRASFAARLEKKAGTQLKLIARKLKCKAKLEHEIESAEVELIRLCEAIRRYGDHARVPGERVVHLPQVANVDVGTYEWLKTSRIIITDGEDEQAKAERIEATEGLGPDYIRVKKTINREMFENHLDKLALIAGLEKADNELFVVKPFAPRRAEHDPFENRWSHKANGAKRTTPAVQAAA